MQFRRNDYEWILRDMHEERVNVRRVLGSGRVADVWGMRRVGGSLSAGRAGFWTMVECLHLGGYFI